MNITDLDEKILSLFPTAAERDLGNYSYIKYPRMLPMLRMQVKSYVVPDFGYLMCMNTSMMGIMKLSTFSIMPSAGISVPYLLIDTMSMGKKRLAYVELYDCRKDKTQIPELEQLEQKYSFLDDYDEKPAWYVNERMAGSLIKCASGDKEDALCGMTVDALTVYSHIAEKAGSDPENIKGLKPFADRMILEGNPSSTTLNRALGKERAEDFFRKVVMPF